MTCTLTVSFSDTHPQIGRFLSVDPVKATSVGGNFNRYWYANDNPYKFTDPDGRCGKVTGSMICGGAAGLAAMAKTGVVSKVFTSNDVSSVGPQQAGGKQVQTMVDDANKAGETATLAGDSRAVRAFNKIGGIKIDTSDWNVATYKGSLSDPKEIAFVEYDGGDTGSVVVSSTRYFASPEYWRVLKFLHETMHFDDAFHLQQVTEQRACPTCSGWDFKYEWAVDHYAKDVFNRGWHKLRQ